MHPKKPTWVLGESPLREVDHRTFRERSELTQALRHAHSAAEAALDVSRLRRISLLGIGREFDAELALADLRFYKGGG